MRRHYTDGKVTKVMYRCDCGRTIEMYANNPNPLPYCTECENMRCVGRA